MNARRGAMSRLPASLAGAGDHGRHHASHGIGFGRSPGGRRTGSTRRCPAPSALTGDVDFADQIVVRTDKFLLDLTERSVGRRSGYWHRDFSSSAAYAKSIEPNRARLAKIVGLRDARVARVKLELQATTDSCRRGWPRGPATRSSPLRGPPLATCMARACCLVPTGRPPVADVVAIPDCGQTPEQLVGLAPGCRPRAIRPAAG